MSIAAWAGLVLAAAMVDLNARPPAGAWAIAITVFVLLFVVPVVALGAHLSTPPDDAPRTLRLRRIVSLCAVLALIGLAPAFATYPFSELNAAIALGLFVALMLLPAIQVYRKPGLANAIIWSVWMSPFVALAFLVGFDNPVHEWDARVMQVALGCIFVLVLIVQPVVALVSRSGDALPVARVT